jgi:5'-nucleotidase
VKLIVTNDDGYDAPGLRALLEICEALGTPVVVAPSGPQSAVGHRVTTRAPIALEEVDRDRFRVDGTPADCARIALRHVAPDADWLIAGINHGGNLGADVYISATVAAAREAALLGCRAISISQYVPPRWQVDWDLTRRRAERALRLLLERPLQSGSYWNVNLPAPPGRDVDLEIAFCALDPSPLPVGYRRIDDELIYSGDYHSRPRLPGRDVDVCFGGRIAITAIPLDLEK